MNGTDDERTTDPRTWAIRREITRQLKQLGKAPAPVPPEEKMELPELPPIEWKGETHGLRIKASTDIDEIKENMMEVMAHINNAWDSMKVPVMVYQEHDTRAYFAGYHREMLKFDELIEHQLQYHTERGLENTASFKNFSALMQTVRIIKDEQQGNMQKLVLLFDQFTLSMAAAEVYRRKATAAGVMAKGAADLGLELETRAPTEAHVDLEGEPEPTAEMREDNDTDEPEAQEKPASKTKGKVVDEEDLEMDDE